jgi:hypothetical protein
LAIHEKPAAGKNDGCLQLFAEFDQKNMERRESAALLGISLLAWAEHLIFAEASLPSSGSKGLPVLSSVPGRWHRRQQSERAWLSGAEKDAVQTGVCLSWVFGRGNALMNSESIESLFFQWH